MASELLSDFDKLKSSQKTWVLREYVASNAEVVEPLRALVDRASSSRNANGATVKNATLKRDTSQTQSSGTTRTAAVAKRVTFIASGSTTSDKEAIVVLTGKETWQQFLDTISQKMKYQGAVSKVYTDDGQEVTDFDALENGKRYIAVFQGQKLRLGTAPQPAAAPMTPRSAAAPLTPRGTAPSTPRHAPPSAASSPSEPVSKAPVAKTSKPKAAPPASSSSTAVSKAKKASVEPVSSDATGSTEQANGSVTPRNHPETPRGTTTKFKAPAPKPAKASAPTSSPTSTTPKYELPGNPRFGETVMPTAVYQTAYDTLQEIIKKVPYQEPEKQLNEFAQFLRFHWVPTIITTLVCDAFQVVQEKYKILGKAKGSSPAMLARALRDHYKDDPDNVQLTLTLFAACGYPVDLPGTGGNAAEKDGPSTPRRLAKAPSGTQRKAAPAAPPPTPVTQSAASVPANGTAADEVAADGAVAAAAEEPAQQEHQQQQAQDSLIEF